MSNPTPNEIRDHIAALAAPEGGLGELMAIAEQLCRAQGTLRPTGGPRRLVLFAADHGPDAESRVSDAIHDLTSGASATAVLAKATGTELIVVDVGTWCDGLAESPRYRCRKTRSGSGDAGAGPALTADEFRAAFAAGQKEAELAHAAGVRVLAADAIGADSAVVAERVLALHEPADDPMGVFGAVGGSDVAALAGLVAKASELGLTVLAAGAPARAGAHVAERVAPGAAARVIEGRGSPDGLGALLALPALDAAAAVLARTARRHVDRPAARAKPTRKVAVFTGSFDPPTTYHRKVVELLREKGFDEVIVRPSGPRCDGPEVEHAKPVHRAILTDLAFKDVPGVTVDLSDLDDATFTPHFSLDDLLGDRGELWHVVPAEFVTGGRASESAIHNKWELGLDAWATRRFVVLHPPGAAPDDDDLPPKCQLLAVDGHIATADIRLRVFQHGNARPDVSEQVDEYIRRYHLFTGLTIPRETRVHLSGPRLKIVAADRSEKALRAAEPFRHLESPDPTHILVLGGDGTMLQAIRDHWRLRLPFLGLNAGTLGFLMNERLPPSLENTEIVLYRMPMMRVDAELPDGKRVQSLAFADAWVERDSGQAAWLKIDVDGHTQVPRVVGDGLLVATPAGSSAYARAMGATSVPLTAPVFTLAGSNVFRPRFWKPVALPETAHVSFTTLDFNGKRPIRGFIDGQPIGPVKSMHIRVSTVANVELGFTPEFDLSARLLRSMFPPSDPL
ncbi:nicotinate-nucleotide--dimethylbenzimidazole phosphoribosyltransferase [Gemmata sp. JC673]|uniref:Nicotinate-nucleotide--dimethylbenzimidazole phosphoribosyltransferase n=1 Tax=Gemmata algarum TaxID=2975278 RepID=A0ABU5F6K8_9BACT|nr:nicotinate-nucleotide--dimethylbenzimidazole phosphoribosyltransferase [Gemmata algarum]MDY3563124.1 nicotinate-nucleotide--dimethylbenzimidazole phosphoribosyltransferase [Gemmata algarum]